MTNCPQCGKVFVGDKEYLSCQECGAKLDAQLRFVEQGPAVATRRVGGKLTIVLISLNVLMFLLVVVTGGSIMNPSIEKLLKWGANYGPLTLTGQWWRLESSTFLHGGLFHLLFNMWAFLNLGLLAEIIFGADQFLMLYLLAGLGGSVASLWWHPTVVGVGASGAIFGVAGALLPALFFERNQRLRAAMRGNLGSIAFFVIYNIIYGAGSLHIDNAAHMGGLATGLVLGLGLPTATAGPLSRSRGRSVAVFLAIGGLIFAGAMQAKKVGGPVIAYSKAQQALQAGRLDEAIALVQTATREKPDFTEAHYLLGSLYLQTKRPELAIPELKKATQQAPDFPDGFAQLCVATLRAPNPGEALEPCKRAVQLDPKDADSQFNLGLVYRAMKDKSQALAAFNMALALRPDGADENYWLGIAMMDNGDYAKAREQFEKVMRIDPNYEGAAAALEVAKEKSRSSN